VAVGKVLERAGRTIDAAGRVVAPGFIDAHAHSDFALLRDPRNPEKVMQGGG
jgi:N-acyl-D-amino-acid deacylase